MNKYILILACFLTGCGGGGSSSEPEKMAYIIAGQSNARFCDWSYFEERTGAELVNISKSGRRIDELIDMLRPDHLTHPNYKGIIFVHGEADSRQGTPVNEYVANVERYRQDISVLVGKDLPLIISTVGYRLGEPKAHYDAIREAVINEANINSKWLIGSNEAHKFPSMGYLKDKVHFTESGCLVIQDQISESISM